MSSKTRIVVLHMKEVIYTAIFLVLGLLMIVLLLIMFQTIERQRNCILCPDNFCPHRTVFAGCLHHRHRAERQHL